MTAHVTLPRGLRPDDSEEDGLSMLERNLYFLLVEVNLPIWVPDFFVFVGVFIGALP